MKALIKSTDGSGWVEARVKDKIQYWHPSEVIVGFVIAIDKDAVQIEYLHGLKWVTARNCQLIERPIQIGDELEADASLKSKNQEPFARVLRFIANQDHIDAINSGDLMVQVRHSSTLLRPVVDV